MRHTPRTNRRSFVLIAVMVIVGSAILITTTLLFRIQVDAAAGDYYARQIAAKHLSRSAVQLLVSELNSQRDRILDSQLPSIDDQYTVYEAGGRMGVVRLLAVDQTRQQYIEPEAGKIDLNEATATMLADSGLVDAQTAEAIINYRDNTLGPGGPGFTSVAQLLRVDGVKAETLYGELDAYRLRDPALRTRDQRALDATQSSIQHSARGLADVVTVYGFEPPLQRDGVKRINLNVEWSEELGRRLDDRFGQGAGQIVQQIMQQGTTFDSNAVIVQTLRSLNAPQEDWPEIVDALTTVSSDFAFGRVDINTAPYEALVALPGIEAEQAQLIVDARESLSNDRRGSIVWPILEQIIEPQAYDELADRITTRCWTYRARFVAGETSVDTPEAPLDDALVYEVVIDLAAPQPRVAYLREITMFDTTARLALLADEAQSASDGFETADVRREDAATAPPDGPFAPAGSGEMMTLGDLPAASGSPLDGSSGQSPGTAGAGEDDAAQPFQARSASPADEEGTASAGGAPAGGSDARRRVGRWRPPG